MFARGCGQPIKEVHSLRPPTLDRARTRATCFGRGLNRGSAPILPSCPPSRTACSPAACSWGQQQPWAIPAAFRARWQCGDRGRSEHGHRLPSAGSRDPVSPQAAGRYPTSLQISALAIGGLRATHLEPGGAEREGWGSSNVAPGLRQGAAGQGSTGRAQPSSQPLPAWGLLQPQALLQELPRVSSSAQDRGVPALPLDLISIFN